MQMQEIMDEVLYNIVLHEILIYIEYRDMSNII